MVRQSSVLVLIFRKTCAHYSNVSAQLRIDPNETIYMVPKENIDVVLVQGINKGTLSALNYALSLSKDCIAVHVQSDEVQTATFANIGLAYFLMSDWKT